MSRLAATAASAVRRPPMREEVAHRGDAPRATVPPAMRTDSLPSRSGMAASEAVATVSASWRAALSAWLEAHKFYPERARRRGEQGTVAMRFTVARDGQVTDVAVAHGSGSDILDAAAQNLLHEGRIPPLTADMPRQITVTVAIRYALEP